ncbi:unnamed protein product [Kluyveromyces dobzhanskii CBS 2104]|uniref:ATP-dependent DNA helicase CHL1 n=1 Tax=Kluyveromyces dobzhanskii CBS 2104 TaxID=1427455 RepID=A0A0A8LCB1_9SACH|nr:unnamed protein product [Kluyveromyces dobzhanskii CBS 2104]
MGKDFHHPFQPYDIQVQLMDKIYDLLNSDKKVGIFESPTGTGKTLSLICSTVTWLRENKLDNLSKTLDNSSLSDSEFTSSDEEPEWVNQFYNDKILKEKSKVLQDYETYLDTLSASNVKPVLRQLDNHDRKRQKKIIKHVDVSLEDNEGAFLPDPYEQDSSPNDSKTQLNDEIHNLLAKIDKGYGVKTEQQLDFTSPLKIYFSSRTHSQLMQFASQLTLPSFPPSSPMLANERIKFLPLASRKQLCINENVSKLKSDLINDSCADAVKKHECQFYTNSKDNLTSKQFRDYTFAEINDIEDMVKLGKSLRVCPYYSSRTALAGAEIVTLPYQHLLSFEVRQSLGIDLKDSIVIIDEAHNLMDTITNIYSCDISLADILSCKELMTTYFNRFKRRLNGGNRVNLMKIMKLLNIIQTFIQKNFERGKEILPQIIIQDNNADLLKIHELVTYMRVSKIAYKIDSFADSKPKSNAPHFNTIKQPVLFKFSKFITSLSNLSTEGKFFFEDEMTIKYMLLEPNMVFKTIVEESKCVILAGGTMQPTSDFTENLLPFVAQDKIVQYSCNHIIPDSNLDTYVVSNGFNFNYEKRNAELVMKNLFEFLEELGTRVPYGIVAFFPSYKYLEQIVSFWKSKGFFERLKGIKEIFYETHGGADVLTEYSARILDQHKGAFIFSVVGGKLSEGINFQDNLARAVVMVGLPFPNVYSSELLVKKKHIEQKIFSAGGSQKDADVATNEFYENICMKAVNQSIGRAIRHENDYACIYLVDERYLIGKVQNKLSQWVRKRIKPQSNTRDVLNETSIFFQQKH